MLIPFVNLQICKFNKPVGKNTFYLEINFLRVLRLRMYAMCKPAGPIDNYMRDNVPWTMLIKTLVHSSPQALAVCAQVAGVTSFFLPFHPN